MEDLVQQLISQGPIGIVCAAIVFIVITIQRMNTAKKRDGEKETIETRLSLLESKVEKIEELDLSGKLAQIMTDLQWLKERLK